MRNARCSRLIWSYCKWTSPWHHAPYAELGNNAQRFEDFVLGYSAVGPWVAFNVRSPPPFPFKALDGVLCDASSLVFVADVSVYDETDEEATPANRLYRQIEEFSRVVNTFRQSVMYPYGSRFREERPVFLLLKPPSLPLPL